MTSRVWRSKRSDGFTLLEIVIVITIAVLMMSGALVAMRYSSDERVLHRASGEVELLAKRARMQAVLKQTPYALVFRQGRVNMMPLAKAWREVNAEESKMRKADPKEMVGGEEEQYVLEEGMAVTVRRWNSNQWLTTLKDVAHIWRFDPNGLCEPLTVRLDYRKSWEQNTYHPLTATAVDTEMEVQ